MILPCLVGVLGSVIQLIANDAWIVRFTYLLFFQTCLARHGNDKTSSEHMSATSTLAGSIGVKTTC